MTSRRVTEFVGVSSEPGLGIAEGIGPYEFFTESSIRVYLHDTDFLGLVWQPDATVRFYFSYDPDWTPTAAEATPVIELTFSHAEMLQWETDLDSAQDEVALGQVSLFDWDGRDRFQLATWTLDLWFSADRMAVRLLAAAPNGINPRS